MATTGTLAIVHNEASSPPAFHLTRLPDGKSAASVTIPSPYNPLASQPNTNLMKELRWYLEQFLDYPFPPETDHADRVLDALKAWGTKPSTPSSITATPQTGSPTPPSCKSAATTRTSSPGPGKPSSSPKPTTSPTSAASSAASTNSATPQPSTPVKATASNILLVVARPYKADVRYRSIARPLVDLIQSKGLPAHVDVLRPPTFDQLREHVRKNPGYYHVLHFDGDGSYADGAGKSASPHQYKGRQGCLVFEGENSEPDPKSARDLSTLLAEYAVPAVVLNACQSAMLDTN